MIRHIVFWKICPDTDRHAAAAGIKQRLEPLVGIVPGLVSAEVGEVPAGGDWDAALCAVLESEEALRVYQTHPAHLAAKTYVHSVICGRTCVDYKI